MKQQFLKQRHIIMAVAALVVVLAASIWLKIGAESAAAVTAAYAVLVYYQLRVMLDQREAHEKLARDQLNELKGQADQAHRSADLAERSARAAEQTASTANQDMTIRHRAWVIAGSAQPGPQNVARLPVTVHLKLDNAGPTPALELNVAHCFRLGPQFHSVPQPEVTTRLGSLGPNTIHTVSAELDPPPSDIKAFHEGNLKLFFSGSVSYDDVFRHRHSTSWAFEWDPSSWTFVRSSFHNEMLDWAPPEDLAEPPAKPEL